LAVNLAQQARPRPARSDDILNEAVGRPAATEIYRAGRFRTCGTFIIQSASFFTWASEHLSTCLCVLVTGRCVLVEWREGSARLACSTPVCPPTLSTTLPRVPRACVARAHCSLQLLSATAPLISECTVLWSHFVDECITRSKIVLC